MNEYVSLLIEDRIEDIEHINTANQSYDDITAYIQALGGDVDAFASVFQKETGYFVGFALGSRIKRKEHLKLSIYFLERELFNVKKTINAQAFRLKVQPYNPNSAQLKRFQINIYFNAPPEVKTTPKSYNTWFAQNLATIINNPITRSSYIHELTHVMDFKRMDPNFLLQRSNKKQQTLDAGLKRDFDQYANDPLELNAYFSQAMSDIVNAIKTAQSEEEKQAILGTSAQEFANKFMTVYLKKQVAKHLDADNSRKLMSRAATAWDHLKEI